MKGIVKPFRYLEKEEVIVRKITVGQRRMTTIDDAGRRYEKVKPFMKVKEVC